jgi:hypothetical protein
MNFYTFLAVITCCAMLALALIDGKRHDCTQSKPLIKQEKSHA